MIRKSEPLSMAEALEHIDKEAPVVGFIKKLTKLKPSEAKEFKEKLQGLEMMKLKDENIIKIIDLMPETKEELNKILVGVNLDEDETKKILDTVKEFK